MNELPLKFQALKEIAELSPESVFIYDLANKKISYANDLAFELLGIRKDASYLELLSIYERVVPDDREYLKRQYLKAIRQSDTAESEFRLVTKYGERAVICCTTYLLDSNIVVFIRDITQPKMHENYLVEFGSRKNTVLDILTHQLSGALNLMKHLSGEASKYVNDSSDKNLKIFFELLNNNNAQCLGVINDLLRNEHERSPKVVVKSTRIDIVAKVNLVYDEFRQSYKNRIFKFIHTADSLFINTDEVKLLQIINNLVSNAIKFSPNEQPIGIKIIGNTSDIVVSIQDHGIGIPDSLTPFVFDRQSIASRTGLNGESSTGFGLSICKKLAELMGGRIWFDTEVNKGSTFYLSLPKK